MPHSQKRFLYLISFSLLFLALSLSPLSPLTAAAKPKPLAGFNVIALYPDLAQDLGFPREQQGLVVTGIYQGSPAEKAELHEGDLIIKVQAAKGKAVEVKDFAGYNKAVDAIPAAKPVIFTVIRKSQELTIELVRSTAQFGGIIQPPAAEQPSTIKVAPDGSGDSRSVDGAVLLSRPGDTILLSVGKYPFLHLGRDRVTINSLDPQNPAVLGGVNFNGVSGSGLEGVNLVSEENGKGIGVSGSGKRITVRNCRIRGFYTGIYISGSDILLDGNHIHDNANWAINLDTKGSSVKVSRNLIDKNGRGIGVFADGQYEIIHNTIIENRVSPRQFLETLHKENGIPGIGIAVTAEGRAVIVNNIVAYNNIGCFIEANARATVEYNDVYGQVIERTVLEISIWGHTRTISDCNSNYLSVIRWNSQDNNITNTPLLLFQPSKTNISADPLFADPLKGDYRLANDSPLIGKGRDNMYIGAFPPIGPGQGQETQGQAPSFGIFAQPLSDLEREKLGLASRYGLRVTEVKKGGLAEKMQIKVDDVIIEINGKTFQNIDEFKKLIATPAITSIKLLRDGAEMVLIMPLEF
ncbi:MAG: PDZ domain-containing protein [Bacillota bacterium]